MEIEKRAFVEDFSDVREKLEQLGFTKAGEKNIVDRYFCREDVNTVEEVQMDAPGSYGLRIRVTGERKELNCKVIESQGDHNAFIEHETQIQSVEEARKILEAIGFKQFIEIRKKREIFEKNGLEVNLEDLENFSPVIELELIAEENISEKKEQLNELMEKLGVEDEDMIEKSITLLYMRENAFKD